VGAYEAGEFTSGAEFGELFLTYVAAMREVDPQIRFVVGGAPWPDFVAGLPEGSDLAVVGNKLDTWNRDLVRVVGEEIEAISMHYTFPGALGRLIHDTPGDLLQVATGGDALGPMLDRTLAEVRATPGGGRLSLQLLEWGWQVHSDELLGTNHRLGDALLLAGCWNRMIERPDGVRLATMNHLVSTLSSIQTRGDDVFTTALYLVSRLYRETTRASARAVEVRSPTLHVPRIDDVENAMHVMEAAATAREAPVLDAAVTSDERGLTVFIANRSLDEPLSVTVTGLPGDGVATLRRLAGPSPYARNDVGQELLGLTTEELSVSNGRVEVTLPPATVAAVLTGD
jgi:alpha-L-arabinofuranosidase